MRCEQAMKLMSARLDGELGEKEIARLEAHMATCSACRAEWYRLRAMDRLLCSAAMLSAPSGFPLRVMARIRRRDRTRRVVIGGVLLLLGTIALSLLVVAPALLGLLRVADIVPVLVVGGPEVLAHLFALPRVLAKTALLLVNQFATPIVFVGAFGLMVTLALNGLWIGAVHRLQSARRTTSGT